MAARQFRTAGNVKLISSNNSLGYCIASILSSFIVLHNFEHKKYITRILCAACENHILAVYLLYNVPKCLYFPKLVLKELAAGYFRTLLKIWGSILMDSTFSFLVTFTPGTPGKVSPNVSPTVAQRTEQAESCRRRHLATTGLSLLRLCHPADFRALATGPGDLCIANFVRMSV